MRAKIPLEDILIDNPQRLSLIELFEEDTSNLRNWSHQLNFALEKWSSAQKLLSKTTGDLASVISSYGNQKFPLDETLFDIPSVTNRVAHTLNEIMSWMDILNEQINCCIRYPVRKLTRELDYLVEEIRPNYAEISAHLAECEEKFAKANRKEVSRKLDELNNDVFINKMNYHKIALEYFSRMNALQGTRYTQLIEPVVAMLCTFRSYFGIGNDALRKESFTEFLTICQQQMQSIDEEIESEKKECSVILASLDSLSKNDSEVYYGEPAIQKNSLSENVQKQGYLRIKIKSGFFSNNWEKYFVFTQGSSLMWQKHNELAASLMGNNDFIEEDSLPSECGSSFTVSVEIVFIPLYSFSSSHHYWLDCLQRLQGPYGRLPVSTQLKRNGSDITIDTPFCLELSEAPQVWIVIAWITTSISVLIFHSDTAKTSPPVQRAVLLDRFRAIILACEHISFISLRIALSLDCALIACTTGLAIDLVATPGTSAEIAGDDIDRRFVFVLLIPFSSENRNQKWFLQAKNTTDMYEWVDVINNLSGFQRKKSNIDVITQDHNLGDLVGVADLSKNISSSSSHLVLDLSNMNLSHQPIQFDLLPVEQSLEGIDSSIISENNVSYDICFLGSLEIGINYCNEAYVQQAIQKVLDAREAHSIHESTACRMLINKNARTVILVDYEQKSSLKALFEFADITFWTTYSNSKIFAIVTRIRTGKDAVDSAKCSILINEEDGGGDEICKALASALRESLSSLVLQSSGTSESDVASLKNGGNEKSS
ncbi:unnamed protein product [Dracunculus medinensis]|uniref:PH domain-containing protein n=1 Tax=Dracunculus medinensis TaxID=318479 RepID=A0A158Q340_DRAME|nr:unnamed protein product [Dracunculus medinensis]